MKTILIQLDTDPHPSTFDRVVAVDAGVEEVLAYGNVAPDDVEPLVHGAIFTRGPEDLKSTALFVGGSDVAAGEKVLARVLKTFFGPMRVSVMMDSNGSNTTAAAAVLAARKHVSFQGATALVLGGTGPVGRRAAQLLAAEGAAVRIGSRSKERAESIAAEIRRAVANASVEAHAAADEPSILAASRDVSVLIAAGAAGVPFLPAEQFGSLGSLRVAIDLNAVPPSGLGGIEVTDKALERGGVICYGAVGVGRTKMKIHKAAVKSLFESNARVLDTDAIYRIGEAVAG